MRKSELRIKHLGLVDYQETWDAMKRFTLERSADSVDELWLLEHHPVFSQGQAGKAEHVIGETDIPIIKSDRGGQVTYHGPGQLVVYILLDLKRLSMGVRELVTHIETTVVDVLASYGVEAAARADAPGVYVGAKKIASLGLRVRRGCSFHGVAINLSADLSPFKLINPCGYAGMEMVNLSSLVRPQADISINEVSRHFYSVFGQKVGLEPQL